MEKTKKNYEDRKKITKRKDTSYFEMVFLHS